MIIQETNNILTKLLEYDDSNNIPEEDLNEIILHAVIHVWDNEAMILWLELKGDKCRSVLKTLITCRLQNQYTNVTENIIKPNTPGYIKMVPVEEKKGNRIRLAFNLLEEMHW